MSPHLSTPTPYPLTETAIGYRFATDLGEQYEMYYTPAEDYFPGIEVGQNALMFGFTRVVGEGQDFDDVTPPEDPRIKATILNEIKCFFKDSNKILVFFCHDGKKQRAAYRHRLFGKWFRGAKKPRLVRAVVHEGNGLFAFIIYSLDNPLAYTLAHDLPSVDDKINHVTGQVG